MRVVIAVTPRDAITHVARGVVGSIFIIPFLYVMRTHMQALGVILFFTFLLMGLYGVWMSFVITFRSLRGRR